MISEVAVIVTFAMIAFVSRTFSSISSVLLLLTLLYHLHHDYKLLKITWSIIERKLINLRRLELLLLSLSPWLCLSLEFSHQIYLINLLYYLNYGCKLLRMTWSIVDRKPMNLWRLELLLLLLLLWLRLCYHFFNKFYYLFISFFIYKLPKMIWYLIDRKANAFRMSGVTLDLGITCYHCLSLCL